MSDPSPIRRIAPEAARRHRIYDLNHDGGEPRLMAIGPIADRLHVLVFSVETALVRVISLRRANNREIRRYEHAV